MKLLRRLLTFAKALATDKRVPRRDRLVIAAMLAYLASPLDLIPDFIPVLGYLDDAILVVLLLDYAFNHLDRGLLAEVWPWSERSLRRWRKFVSVAAWVVPGPLRRRLWAAAPTAADSPAQPGDTQEPNGKRH